MTNFVFAYLSGCNLSNLTQEQKARVRRTEGRRRTAKGSRSPVLGRIWTLSDNGAKPSSIVGKCRLPETSRNRLKAEASCELSVPNVILGCRLHFTRRMEAPVPYGDFGTVFKPQVDQQSAHQSARPQRLVVVCRRQRKSQQFRERRSSRSPPVGEGKPGSLQTGEKLRLAKPTRLRVMIVVYEVNMVWSLAGSGWVTVKSTCRA